MKNIFFLCLISSTGLYAQIADTLSNTISRKLIAPKYTQSKQWGYILGHNHEYRQQYAEKYYVNGSVSVAGVIAHFMGKYANPLNAIELSAFKVGANKLPNSKRAAKDVLYKDLKLDGSAMTIMFNTRPTMVDSFFVSANFYDYAHGGYDGDTIGLMCTELGSRQASDLSNFGRNVVQRHNHDKIDWRDFYSQNFTPMAVHFALFPIVEYPVTGTSEAYAQQSGLKIYAPFPNPMLVSTQISFELASPSDVELTILRIDGQHIKTMELGNKTIGTHREQIDMEGFSAGSYILVVKTDQTAIATKLIVQ